MRFAALTARKGERGLNICGIRFGGYAGIFSAENVTADPVFSADIRAAFMRGVFKII